MLAREFKLKNSEEIKVVLKQGQNVRSDFLTLFFALNTVGHCRGAVVIGRKVAPNAVRRNRVRRIIFHFLRNRFDVWGNREARDMVVMVMSIPPDDKLAFPKDASPDRRLLIDLEKCFAKLQ